jgi:pimeloyl-ACP methyl ester carboxylesterase
MQTHHRRRLVRAALVAVLIVLVVAMAGLTGVGWYYSDQLLDPAKARPGFPDTALGGAEDGGTPVVLLAASANASRAGEWGLIWPDGAARVGAVVRDSDGRVERRLLDGTAPPAGTRVRLDPGMWRGDPRTAVGLDFQDVTVPTELGPAPAWYVPAPADQPGSTWAITVHGRGGSRLEALRVLPTLHRLGLPVLDLTYRNDEGAPRSPDGLLHLGDTEWRDVASAIRYALDHGARRVALCGWSMGGAVVEQVLARSELAGSVTAVVLDAPVSSWSETLRQQARNRNVPTALVPVAMAVSGWRGGIDFDRMELVDDPPVARPPTLLVHGDVDGTVPVTESRELAAAADRLHWPIRYLEVTGAEHTAAWNVDPARYEAALSGFLSGLVTR